jgi:hypothetical protein
MGNKFPVQFAKHVPSGSIQLAVAFNLLLISLCHFNQTNSLMTEPEDSNPMGQELSTAHDSEVIKSCSHINNPFL